MAEQDAQVDEKELLLKVIHENLAVKSHFQLLSWLQGNLQHFLPHDILISAWGDFSLGLIYLDIVALHPLLRTKNITKNTLEPKILALFTLWNGTKKPLQLNIEDGYFDINASLKKVVDEYTTEIDRCKTMNSAILHGIKDTRGSYDCLYILLSETAIPTNAKDKLAIFLPFIDSAFRRIQLLEDESAEKPKENETEIDYNLSNRELEIMDLVEAGYTNDEIALELDISIYTVKNHLQKIFKKLGAANRSQAAFKYKSGKN